jgi:aldehyde dehydrogenase (NAD+)
MPSSTSPSSTPLDAEVLNKTLRTTFESGRTRPLAWRKEQLAGLRRMLEENDRQLVDALAADLGRPSMEAFAADIGHAKMELRHLHGHVADWMKPKRSACRWRWRRPRAGSRRSRSAWPW